MDNEYTNTLNTLYLQEKQLSDKVEECEENARRAISELHQALVDLNEIKTQEKAVLVDLQAFTERIQRNVVGVNVDNVLHKKTEVLSLIENISWSVSKLLDLNSDIERDLTRHDE